MVEISDNVKQLFLDGVEELTMEQFALRSDLLDILNPMKFKITDLGTKEQLEEAFKNKPCAYSTRGNTGLVIGKCFFFKLKDGFYIYDDVNCEKELSMAKRLANPLISDKNFTSLKIYKGITNTGSHLNYDNFSVDFLFKGKKLWYVFPNTKKNLDALHDIGYYYLVKQRHSVKIWIIRKKRFFEKALDGVVKFEQSANEVVCIPDQWWYINLNLEDSEGLKYIW